MATVEELLHHALPPASQVRAGEAGLGREVSWAVRLRPRAPAFDRLNGDELAIVPLRHLRSVDERLTPKRLVEQCALAGLSALAVIGEVDSAAAETAERHGIALIGLPESTDPATLELSVQRWLLDRRLQAHQEAHSLQQELASMALAGAGLPALLAAVARLTGKLCFLHGPDGRLWLERGSSRSDLSTEQLKEAVAAGSEGWRSRSPNADGQATMAYVELPQLGLVQLVAPVPDGQAVGGYLSLVSRPVDVVERDRSVLTAAASACSIELVRQHAATAARDELEGDLIATLLQGDFASDEALFARALRLGHDLTMPHAAITLRPPDGPPLQRLTQAIKRLSSGADPVVVTYEGELLALLPLETPTGSEADLAAHARVWHSALARECGPLSMGLGGLHTGADGLGASLREARQALSMGEGLFGPTRLTAFGQLGLFHFLLSGRDATHLRAFEASVLGKLLDYDEAHNAELVDTLGAYFACNCAPHATAERLHLHRNTLRYRLRRIETIAAVDLEDPDTRLLLSLALKVRQAIALAHESDSPAW